MGIHYCFMFNSFVFYAELFRILQKMPPDVEGSIVKLIFIRHDNVISILYLTRHALGKRGGLGDERLHLMNFIFRCFNSRGIIVVHPLGVIF